MTDLNPSVLSIVIVNYITENPGKTAADIGDALGCGELQARRALLTLKSGGKARNTEGPAASYWYRAGGGGYNPPENVA